METKIEDYDFMKKVSDAFLEPRTLTSGSLRAVAMKFGITRTKVRKILITLGALESPLPEEALRLQESGLKLQEISEKLGIPISTLSTYLPYVTVMYNGEVRSANALRIETFRERLANIAQMHHHQENSTAAIEPVIPKTEAIRNFTSTNNQAKESTMLKATEIPVMRLKLELDLDGLLEEDWETLRQYCDVKKGYSREILVPSDMTLHGLHYAIMQLFGWLNGHLRRFTLPEKLLAELTGGRLEDYLELVGLYFRPPVDIDDDDCFWDDDFNGSGSFKAWLRKRYSRPFRFWGKLEQFMRARRRAKSFWREIQVGRLGKALEERRRENDEVKKIVGDSKAVLMKELRICTDFTCGDLLERLELSEILSPGKGDTRNVGNLKRKANDYYEQNLKVGADLNPIVQPLTNTLNYEFDFGDGWKIKITCCETYAESDLDKVEPGLSEKIRGVMETGRPLCVAMDGSRQLVQDVGGIYGYCEFLRTIHGDDEDRKREMKAWASSLSWTGRKASPEKLL